MSINEEMATPISEIQTFYHGKSVFVTGGTGFLGKLLIEKLLRTCKDLKHIYLLLREKKGKTSQERFKDIFDVPAFERLKSEQPNFLSKMTILEGDLVLPNLGLSESHQDILKDEVNCIFHIGATVRFDEKLKRAVYINVRSVRDLILLAQTMKQLESFVHVSTAYSNCPRRDIDEIFYKPLVASDALLTLVDLVDENILDSLTPTLLGENPNTYVLTKALGEDVLKKIAGNLPVVIVRPSIVISSYTDPVPGWIDNIYGPTSIVLGAALGILRTVYGDSTKVVDFVPVDFVINILIAAAWDVAKSGNKLALNENDTTTLAEPKIYNYVSSPQNPITWGDYKEFCEVEGKKIPSPMAIWHFWFNLHSNYYIHWMVAVFTQTLPAYIMDFVARCLGKRPMFVDIYKRIYKFCDVISYFTMSQWRFNNLNTQNLWKRLNSTDKEVYNFDIASMPWSDYFKTFAIGIRIYLLKDPMDTLPQGKRKMLMVAIAHYTLITVLFLLFCTLAICLYHMLL